MRYPGNLSVVLLIQEGLKMKKNLKWSALVILLAGNIVFFLFFTIPNLERWKIYMTGEMKVDGQVIKKGEVLKIDVCCELTTGNMDEDFENVVFLLGPGGSLSVADVFLGRNGPVVVLTVLNDGQFPECENRHIVDMKRYYPMSSAEKDFDISLSIPAKAFLKMRIEARGQMIEAKKAQDNSYAKM